MQIATLRDLYLAELTDLCDVEQQILMELPLMAASATSPKLREAFDDHYRQTQQHAERLDHLFRQLDERPRQQQCRGLRGIIEEGRASQANVERGEVLDAALIAAAQRIEHYEIAAYGCARTYAATLGDPTGAVILQQTLDEEGGMSRHLAALAGAGMQPAETATRPAEAPELRQNVWAAEASGFASVPARAATDLLSPPGAPTAAEIRATTSPENELMVARGDQEG